MAQQPRFLALTQKRVEKGAKALGLGLSGIYLLTFFGFCLWLVITTLAAYQIQTRVSAISIAGQPVSVWAVRHTADILNQSQSRINPIQKEVDRLKKEIELQRTQAEKAYTAWKTSDEEVDRHYNAGREYLKSNGFPTPDDQPLEAVLGGLHTALKDYSGDPENEPKEKRARELANNLMQAVQDHKRPTEISRFAASKLKALNEQMSAKLVELSSVDKNMIDNAMKKIFSEKVEPGEINKLQNLAGEVNSLRGLALFGFFEFVTLQPEVLTLIVVLGMGVLGGLIHLTQGFLSGSDQEPFSYYLFRPVLGAVTALAVYILAKAGVLVVAEARPSDSQGAALSPFFISFLAIISGLLAENAIGNIRKAGENFLRPVDSTGTSRWAIRVKEAMGEAGNKTAAELLPFLDHPKGEVEDWIEGRRKIPENVQDVIAAWLGKPARELFTDIEPIQKK